MNPMKTIIPLAIYVIAAFSTGCVATTGANNASPERKRHSPEHILKTLQAGSMSQVRAKNGYKYRWDDEIRLNVLAGRYAGTTNYERTKKDDVSTGMINNSLNFQEAFYKSLSNADTNKDKLVSPDEVQHLYKKIMN